MDRRRPVPGARAHSRAGAAAAAPVPDRGRAGHGGRRRAGPRREAGPRAHPGRLRRPGGRPAAGGHGIRGRGSAGSGARGPGHGRRHQPVDRARRDECRRSADPAHLRDRVRRPPHRRSQRRAGPARGPGLPRPGHPVGRPADAAHHVGRAVLGHHPRPGGRRLPQRPRSCRVAAARPRPGGAPDEPRRGDAHRGHRRRLRGGEGAAPTGRALRPLRVDGRLL